MRGGTLSFVATVAGVLIFCIGCFPAAGSTSGSGGSTAFTTPTLELTVSGVHFGPTAPDAGGSASLVTVRDVTGAVTDSTFKMNATLASGGAGCSFIFDSFGGAPIGVGQFTINADATGNTPNGIVTPTGSERVQTPKEGGASCAGSGCDSGAFVITSIDSAHVYGYVEETMQADSGAGVADVVCTFYLPMSDYQP